MDESCLKRVVLHVFSIKLSVPLDKGLLVVSLPQEQGTVSDINRLRGVACAVNLENSQSLV